MIFFFFYYLFKARPATNISTDTKVTTPIPKNVFLTAFAVFSPPSRDELKRAVDDCLGVSSEGNQPRRLPGPIGKWDVSQVTDMSEMFHDRETFNYDISNWDVSRVTNMPAMFGEARSFNQDLSKWDVSRVTNMEAMFAAASAFNQDLSNWDVSRVTLMAAMFNIAESFNQDMSNWDVSRVPDMHGMFARASAFNQDVSKWDVSRVTNMVAMFNSAKSFNRDLSKWDVSRVTNMDYMFSKASSFYQTLCGAAWVNSNASKLEMFEDSPGSISKTACGTCANWHFVCSFQFLSFCTPEKTLTRPCTHLRTLSSLTRTHTLLTCPPS